MAVGEGLALFDLGMESNHGLWPIPYLCGRARYDDIAAAIAGFIVLGWSRLAEVVGRDGEDVDPNAPGKIVLTCF